MLNVMSPKDTIIINVDDNISNLISLPLRETIKKVIYDYILFEMNDALTRLNVRSIINFSFPELEVFNIVCDSTNNTPIMIDNNQIVIDIKEI